MQLKRGQHLAYCTNIHRGETWPETIRSLQEYTLAVRERVAPGKRYAIGLRLGAAAAAQLSQRDTLLGFQRWLDQHDCYVFTINGFPYGQFHGTRVKEQVYRPDWTSPERVAYTNQLFDLLAQLVPAGVEGSVSSVPGSFKEFVQHAEQIDQMAKNVAACVDHIARVSERSGRDLHLGLEPEPLCYLEVTRELVEFYERVRELGPNPELLARHLGMNYDACHLAVEYETPEAGLELLREHKIRLSKVHLSSALKVQPTASVRGRLRDFVEDTYLHQVIQRGPDGQLARFRDLDEALASPLLTDAGGYEWRIHFHIPLHSATTDLFQNTTDQLLRVMDYLQREPALCSHLEMETYTWEVMPPELKNRSVVEQLVCEYEWTLRELARRGLA